MNYKCIISRYINPIDGTPIECPTICIENQEEYGYFFGAEINNLSSNLDYVKEIVLKIEEVLEGRKNFYEGFGFEIYMIECDKEKALVKNIFENDNIEAIIPTQELYEMMRNWRDYLIEYYSNKT